MKGPSHPTLAAGFIEDKERARWHDQTLWFVRHKRALAAKSLPEWETLRTAASAVVESMER